MQYFVSLREANQHLPRYINAVELGDEIIITRRGKPIVKMSSLGADRCALDPHKEAARARLLSLMEDGLSLGGKPFDRNSLHES